MIQQTYGPYGAEQVIAYLLLLRAVIGLFRLAARELIDAFKEDRASRLRNDVQESVYS